MIGTRVITVFLFIIDSLHFSSGENTFMSRKYKKHRMAWEWEYDDAISDLITIAPSTSSRPTLSEAPSDHPTISEQPTARPSSKPSRSPSTKPSTNPSLEPTSFPSLSPTLKPSGGPTSSPSSYPSLEPSFFPSSKPTKSPSLSPTLKPSLSPSDFPSSVPSNLPTVTPSTSPSSKPSNKPSKEPTQPPSSEPSVTPTWTPSTSPSIAPTNRPSLAPTDSPTMQPSMVPSDHPTQSNAPSFNPTISLAPSLFISTTQITKFTIVLTTPPSSPPINSNEVVDVAEEILDDHLKKVLSKELKYRGVDLRLVGSRGRRLQKVTTVSCIGEARFNLFEAPDVKMINKHVMEAFSDPDFLLSKLKQSQSAGLQSLLGVKTNDDNKVHNAFNTMHLTVIIVSISVVFIGVAASYIWKKNQENNVRKRLLRAAEYTRQYKGQPQLDDDCFRDITPEPIQISDDNKALERMVMRARHDRGVMNRANELLLQQSDLSQPYDPSNREVRFAPHVQKIDGDYVQQEGLSQDCDTEVDLFNELCSDCSNDSSTMSPLSRGGSVATDTSSSLINLGYNDIESTGDNHIRGNESGEDSTVALNPLEPDSRTDDISLTYSTNIQGIDETKNNTNGYKNVDGNAYFTSQTTRQY